MEEYVFSTWLETLIGGVYNKHVPQLRIVQPDGLVMNGSGRICWEAGKQLTIEACTSKVEGVDPFKGFERVGELVQDRDLCRLTGTTSEEVQFEASAIRELAGSVSGSTRLLSWKFNPPQAEFCEENAFLDLPFDIYGITALLQGFDFDLWSHSSFIEQDGPSKGKNKVRLRLREFEAVCGTCKVWVRDMKHNNLGLRVEVGLEDKDYLWEAFEDAFAALCFFAGRHLGLPGWEITQGRKRRCVLCNTIRRPQEQVYPPFGYGASHNLVWADVSSPMKLAVDFFASPDGGRIRDLLYLWWDSADTMPSARILVLSSLIEGVCKVLEREPARKADEWHVVREWVNSESCALSPEGKDRLLGVLGSTRSLHILTVLGKWQATGRYPVAKADVKVFRQRRNPAAHGGFVTAAREQQSLLRDEARLASLLNRIVLKALGYSGSCARYDLPGWPVGDLEPV